MVDRRTSRLALVGFICSLVWAIGLLSLVRLGLSIAGIRATLGGKHAGRSSAVLGVIISILGLVAAALILEPGGSSPAVT